MNYFSLFSNCIPVQGYFRSAICDLQNQEIHFIPNELLKALQDIKNVDKEAIQNIYDSNTLENLNLFLNYLDNKELGFWTSTPHLFPEMNLEWDYPAKISNAIVEIDITFLENTRKVILELEDLGCSAIELRAYETLPLDKLIEIVSHTSTCSIKSIIIYMKDNTDCNSSILKEIVMDNPRIHSIIIHSSQDDKTILIDTGHYIVFSKEKLTTNSHCGITNISYFSINIPTYTEAQHHNSCLNRKISIDTEGNIKNCPSMSESFGNIKDTTLLEALEKPDFKKYWNINKDKIHVCKDCEFRYICTDCRAYVEDPEDIYSKPLKCGYNPYTGEWSEWSTNPLKQKAIQFYGMEAMIAESTTNS